jgi:hypothetical protein
MDEKPGASEHQIHASLHSEAERCWKISCTCGRCGRPVILTVADRDVARHPDRIPTRRDCAVLLDRHCGPRSLPRPRRGVPPMREALEIAAKWEEYHDIVSRMLWETGRMVKNA